MKDILEKEIAECEEMLKHPLGETEAYAVRYHILCLKDIIRKLPSGNTEPRTGHWIFCKGDWRTCVDGHICSVCKTSYHTQVPYFAEYKYCPNCGARMEADHA